MHKPSEYKAIAAWGNRMGSMPYYIKDQQEAAAAEGAPILAIFKDGNMLHMTGANTWHTLNNVTNESTRDFFRRDHPELAKAAGFVK